MRAVIQLAYRVQKLLWKMFRPRTRGVKVMLFGANGEILLIRNSYGASNLYVLPGGGVRPWESPVKAVRREVREELGCDIHSLVPISIHQATAEGKRDTVYLFEASLVDAPRADGIEVSEARLFALDALPEMLSPATARRLAERRGDIERDGAW